MTTGWPSAWPTKTARRERTFTVALGCGHVAVYGTTRPSPGDVLWCSTCRGYQQLKEQP